MGNRLDHIRKAKKINGKTWDDLCKGLPINGNALRVAFSRDSVDEDFLQIIEENLGLVKRTGRTENNSEKNDTTSFEDMRFEALLAKKVIEEFAPYLRDFQKGHEETGKKVHDINELLKALTKQFILLYNKVETLEEDLQEIKQYSKDVYEVVTPSK